MARVGIVFGLLLCGLTLLGLVTTLAKSPVQFVPMMLGIPVLFCGVVGLNPHRRKHAMYVASAIALLGTIGGVGLCIERTMRWMRLGQTDQHTFYIIVAMTVVSLALLVVCVISFFQDRRRRLSIAPLPNSSIPIDPSPVRGSSDQSKQSRETA